MSTAEELRDAASLLRFDPTEFTTDATVGVALADLLEDIATGLDLGLLNIALEPFAVRVARIINGGAR